jgi:hypothetical protein
MTKVTRSFLAKKENEYLQLENDILKLRAELKKSITILDV